MLPLDSSVNMGSMGGPVCALKRTFVRSSWCSLPYMMPWTETCMVSSTMGSFVVRSLHTGCGQLRCVPCFAVGQVKAVQPPVWHCTKL